MRKLVVILALSVVILLVGCGHSATVAITPIETPWTFDVYITTYCEPSNTGIPIWSPDFSPMTCYVGIGSGAPLSYEQTKSFQAAQSSSGAYDLYQILEATNSSHVAFTKNGVTIFCNITRVCFYWDYQDRQWVQGNASDETTWATKYWGLFKQGE